MSGDKHLHRPLSADWPAMGPATAASVQALGDWRAQAPSAPLAERLADAIEGALLDGRLSLAAPLPSERAMASSVGVSRATVTSAYGMLRERGWLATRRGARSVPVIPASLNEGLSPREAASRDQEMIDLTLAAPAAPAQAYLEAVQRAQGQVARHIATTGLMGAGLASLRERIAERHTGAGLPTRPEEIFVTTGAIAALQLVCAALLPVRAPALAELPSYTGALEALRDRGRPVVGWPIHRGWDVGHFEELVRRRTVRLAYLIPDFHNPTGRVASARERKALAEAARRQGVLLVVDETMRELDLRKRARPERPLAAFAAEAVTLGSLSKVLWGGLRIGWLRAREDLVRELESHPLAQSLAAPVLDQVVAAELIDELDELIRRRRTILRSRRDLLIEAFASMPRVTAPSPPGGLSIWATLDGISSRRLVADAARAGVRLSPGGRFSPDAPLDRHVRIPFALPTHLLEEALKRISPLLGKRANPRRPSRKRHDPATRAA